MLGKSKVPNAAPQWRIFTACGDGLVRGYLVQEKSMETDVLDASACTCHPTHVFLGQGQEATTTPTALGCTQVRVARNYVGDDDMAGDLLVVSMDLAGKVRIWKLPEDMDNKDESSSSTEVANLVAVSEFTVDAATGTCVRILPPKVSGVGDVCIAVALLNGTVACIATGIATPKAKKDPTEAGTILEVLSKPGAIAMSMAWHPSEKYLAIGRQDGLVDIVGGKPHRLIGCHESPVRALNYTPDGHLLVSGSDEGMLAVWDTSRATPALVHHVVQAHDSWILSLTVLSDSRRFVTGSADAKLSVWSVGQMDQPLHTFSGDGALWSSANLQDPPRLVTGSEEGGLHIYSLEP
eukprot:scaffold168_cov124-Cylindrotheca_fusiformis.AAC.10